MKKIYRQGDILFVELDKKDYESNYLRHSHYKKEDLILIKSDVTGHSHKLSSGEINLFSNILNNGVFAVIRADGKTCALHEEHKPILLPKGYYEVRRQRVMIGYVKD